MLKAFAAIFLLWPAIALSADSQTSDVTAPNDFPWSYSLDGNGLEHTKRAYLLVLSAQEQVQVQSECKKPPSESRYGECEHHLRFVPGGRTFVLNNGEDVVLAGSPFGDIATITYGCCGGPNKYTFYDHELKPIGTLQTYHGLDNTGTLSNSIDLDNVRGKEMFLDEVEGAPSGADGFILEHMENGGIKKTPVDIEFNDPKECGRWLFSRYDAEAPQSLSFQSWECDARIWSGTCEKAEDGFKCSLNPHGSH